MYLCHDQANLSTINEQRRWFHPAVKGAEYHCITLQLSQYVISLSNNHWVYHTGSHITRAL